MKKLKGFSIMEVVLSVSIIALILATLGLSFLATQRLRLNAEINSEIQKCGETIIDYLFTLPPNDSYIQSVNQDDAIDLTNTNNLNVISLNDLSTANNNRISIIEILNGILTSCSNSSGFQVVPNNTAGNLGRKGALVLFDQNNPTSPINSRVIFNNQGLYTVTIELYYVWRGNGNIRRGRIIRVSRILLQ
ncbi:MAG: hypothetical protein NZM44_02835 [Candidatus Calescibacterium sp.]|nr:hypothetical protein [Candidatus Calescibacterium sp.]MCX7759469.1 hypothetical protein [bacterium]